MDIKPTPFDELITTWHIEIFKRVAGKSSRDVTFLVSFLKACRVRYLQMQSAVDKQTKEQEIYKTRATQKLKVSFEQLLIDTTSVTEANLSYFSFIDELNRYGRVFKKNGHPVPLYNRIYFYRNKVVEHWDFYGRSLTDTSGAVGHIGKISVPIHFGDLPVVAKKKRSYTALQSAFEESNVNIPDLKDEFDDYKAYSDMIYKNLERIDTELMQEKKAKNGQIKGIPDKIVNALFKYSFPVPIYDVESYIDSLIKWAAKQS